MEHESGLSVVFFNGLKEMYNAEKQLVKALPDMAEAASDEELKDAIQHHLEQTKKQVERLEKVFSRLRMDREEKTCAAMEALIEEGQQAVSEYEEGPVRDAALIIGAQKIEHHEIAAYGSLCELAEVLGYHKISDMLDRSLEEEEETDHLLTELAQDINDEAVEAGEEQYVHA
jgi:ferritin-like metal-binding protein YciE